MELDSTMYMTMSVASIGPATLPRKERYERKNQDESSMLMTIDRCKSSGISNKSSTGMQLCNDDVPGAHSKILHRERKGVTNEVFSGYSRRSDLICPNKMVSSERRVNPLTPQYKLPSFTPSEPYVAPFIRDSFDISDIEGARTRQKRSFVVRESMKLDDIEGTSSSWKPRNERSRRDSPPRDILSVVDAAGKSSSQRSTVDPLDPDYFINGMRYNDKFKPRPNKKFIPQTKLLVTRDINYPPIEYPMIRREYKNINFIGDIVGTQADSIKHGIVSLRQTNPLTPVYQSLDAELLDNPVKSLIPPTLVSIPTFKPSVLHSFNPNGSASLITSKQSSSRLSKSASFTAHESTPVSNEPSRSASTSVSVSRNSFGGTTLSIPRLGALEQEIKSVRDLD